MAGHTVVLNWSNSRRRSRHTFSTRSRPGHKNSSALADVAPSATAGEITTCQYWLLVEIRPVNFHPHRDVTQNVQCDSLPVIWIIVTPVPVDALLPAVQLHESTPLG